MPFLLHEGVCFGQDDYHKVTLREIMDEVSDYTSHKKKPRPSMSDENLLSVIRWTVGYVQNAPRDDVLPFWVWFPRKL